MLQQNLFDLCFTYCSAIFQAYFEVADQSGIMSLVLWNELCPEFYQRLNVGAVLYIQNYTLKQSYSNRSRPQMDHHRMKTFNSVGMFILTDQSFSIILLFCVNSIVVRACYDMWQNSVFVVLERFMAYNPQTLKIIIQK